MKIPLILLLAPACLLAQTMHTEHADLAAGGLLQIHHSQGELSVEAWDRPDVEITTNIAITVAHKGDTLVIGTAVPKHLAYDVEYRIKAPRNARLAVDHGNGEVHVEGLIADVQATVREGSITLHVPGDGAYAIAARSNLGAVYSDFPGQPKSVRWHLGHAFTQSTPAAHKLDLKVCFGDIHIAKS